MAQVIAYSGMYSVVNCKKYPKALWVFGDNLRGVGMGGQAIIRTQVNSIGLPTKRTPGGGEEFFYEGSDTDMLGVVESMIDIRERVRSGKFTQLVLPVFKDTGNSTLGCGLAKLPEKAPSIYAFINAWSVQLCRQRNI